MKKGIRQYSIMCLDDDNNVFFAYTKAESRTHARGVIKDRIYRKCFTAIKAVFGSGNTHYKAIVGRTRQVEWTMPSL